MQDETGMMCLIRLAEKAHELGKNVWLWTGDVWESIDFSSNSLVERLIRECDVVIDGPFIESQKNISLSWRGSENQRVIDVKRTLKSEIVTIYGEEVE